MVGNTSCSGTLAGTVDAAAVRLRLCVRCVAARACVGVRVVACGWLCGCVCVNVYACVFVCLFG